MLIDIDKIVVKDRIRTEMGNLQELADDIKKNGLIQPIAVSKDFVLIAGGRRLEAHKLLGALKIEANMMDIADWEQHLLCEIAENEKRKEFTPEERVIYGLKLEEVERAKAKERQINANLSGKKKEPSSSNDEKGKSIRNYTEAIVAPKIGFGSEATYSRAKTVIKSGDKNLINKMNSGEISIFKAAKLSKGENVKQKIPDYQSRKRISSAEVIRVNQEIRKPSEEGVSKSTEKLKPTTPIIQEMMEILNSFHVNINRFTYMPDLKRLENKKEVSELINKAYENIKKIKKLMEV